MIPLPFELENLPAGTQLKAGLGVATILPDMDFETYSSAGFTWNNLTNKWDCLPGASKKGLSTVSVVRYSEHPDTEILCLAYDLKEGRGKRLWIPGETPLPHNLFDHIKSGGLIEAWNSSFEYWVWNNVGVKRYGFPPLCYTQLRDAMAKARAHALPGKLDTVGEVLKLTNRKDKMGEKLIKLFCIPRDPTKTDSRVRLPMYAMFPNGLYEYNVKDIITEAEASSVIPDLTPFELEFWLCDQAINIRGVHVDIEAINNCITIIEQAYLKYNTELQQLTNGQVKAASEVAKTIKWLGTQGIQTTVLDEASVGLLLKNNKIPINARRVLEIRGLLSSAAVKKLYAMKNQVSGKNRLHDLFIYHSARTGRAAGAGPQPQNLPNSGPVVCRCSCNKHYSIYLNICPWCGFNEHSVILTEWTNSAEWNTNAVEDALTVIKTKSLACVEYYFGNALDIVSGCLRGLFTPAPGHDLLCSDYSAIEAVVLAALSGEEWRMEVFRTHGQIYEMSAAKITNTPFEEFERHKRETGQHHPLRKTVGKVAELASGYQGWTGAWKQFGADEFFNEEQMKTAILSWRKASPNIVAMWGGQFKNRMPYMHGLEGMAISAVLNPGTWYDYRGIKYLMQQDVLYCQLLSGRYITYHKPRLTPSDRGGLALSFEGWNTNPKMGGKGWQRIYTYGGRLTENIVQATARDILAHAIVNLEKSGYPVVMHVHDEIVVEVPENFGSIEELERIMSTMPEWAKEWPIKAKGGWRGKRYRKD